jgi:uncharacterized protein YndB with AHSA1/START domain
MSTGHTLRMERTYNASAERVFDAWTSEEVMRRWWHAGHDWQTTEAEVDLRVGGIIRVKMRDPHKDEEVGGGGQYLEIERPTRLVFTWLWDGTDRRQVIEIDFEEGEDGATTVHLVHRNLWDKAAVRDHDTGWSACFDNLDRVLGGLLS